MVFSDLLVKAFASFMTVSVLSPIGFMPLPTVRVSVPDFPSKAEGIQKFSSCSDLKERISKAESSGSYFLEDFAIAPMATRSAAPSVGSDGSSKSYSATNAQVEGVDEADIVKIGDKLTKEGNRLVFHLTKNRLAISVVQPSDKAASVSVKELDAKFYANDMYVQGDRVMLLGTKTDDRVYISPMQPMMRGIMPPWRGSNLSAAQVWDVSDPANPKIIRTVEFDGSLSSSRMIGGVVYLVMNSWSPWNSLDLLPDEKNLLPAYKDSDASSEYKPMARCSDVAYLDIQPSREFLAVASLPISGTGEVKRDIILGNSQTVYASTENLYAARQDYQYHPIRDSLLPETQESERTIIYKFSLKDGAVKYQSKGSVPGHILNQFSLDESDGNLRVATTKGWAWDEARPSTNNVYILGSDMKPRGKVEGIAPGETIYSVRFMGKRGYMVTFKKIDPFFVFDLSNPDAPKILGKLKIPGYSDYLHPMDENHVIGIGKNAEDAAEQNFAWYQGIKMAVFDVTDVSDPKEMYKTEIGDRGTDSPALHDHKAFLYAPEKQLLALPVQLAELTESVKNDTTRQGSEYGEFKFQGAYVYRLSLEKGFELLGRVTHHEEDDAALKSGYYWGQYDTDIQRVLYVDNSLLTVSNDILKLNDISDLQQTASIAYPKVVEQPYPYRMME